MNTHKPKDTQELFITVGSVKVRSIDPPVVIKGKLIPLSELDPEYANRRAAHVASRQGQMQLRLIRRAAS